MTAHSRLWVAHHINDFDRNDGLGTTWPGRRFGSGMPGTSPPNVTQLRLVSPASTRYAGVLDALRLPQARQFQLTLPRVPIKSP
jgi:hypothetical protein